jgi:hypothetical protein
LVLAGHLGLVRKLQKLDRTLRRGKPSPKWAATAEQQKLL